MWKVADDEIGYTTNTRQMKNERNHRIGREGCNFLCGGENFVKLLIVD